MKILHRLRPRRSSRSRGSSILLLSLLCMIVLLLTAVTLHTLLPSELHASNRSHLDLKGHHVARSGIQESISWLDMKMDKFQQLQQETDLPDYVSGGAHPALDAFIANANARRPFTDGDWRYEIEIHPFQDQNSANQLIEPRFFSVRSTAYLHNKPIRKIDVLLKQKTFAMFGFLDSQTQGATNFKLNGTPQIFGPVHTNGWFNFNTSGMNWSTARAYFEDVVTHAQTSSSAPANGDGNIWTGGAPYDSPTRNYNQIFKGGRNDLRLKNSISLPTDTDELAAIAHPAPPTTPGVHISRSATNFVNGGVYVNGDVGKVNFRLDSKGNQNTVISQLRAGGSNVVSRHVHVASCPRHTETRQRNVSPCLEYYPLPGGGGGVSGPPAAPQCKTWTRENYNATIYDCGNQPINDTYNSAFSEPYETMIYEVTEAPVTVTNSSGQPVTANIGQTLILNRHMDTQASGRPWRVDNVEVLDGQPNGTIYVNGNIGKGDTSSTNSNNYMVYEGVTGIVKGSAIVDSSNQFVLDSRGNRTHNNKIVATPLTNSMTLGGDLLQFDEAKFATIGSLNLEATSGGKYNWTHVARDPYAADPKEQYSPNNQHVLGLVSRDVWLNGPKNNNLLNNGNGVNDVYAVVLAGKPELLPDGSPRLGPNGKPLVSGGFGTYRTHRDNPTDGLGRYRIFGGVIQGTTENNYGDSASNTHHWLDGTGSVGYDVTLLYDIEATRQRVFPNLPEFRIVRYFEQSAREG